MAATRTVIFIALFAAICSAAKVKVENDHLTEYRVQQPARPGQVPFIVSLRRSGRHYCSGAIVANRWIVTVAQCVHGQQPNTIIAMSGLRSLNDAGTSHPLVRIVIHPQYNRRTTSNDIALLRTTKPITFSVGRVRAVPLPIDHIVARQRQQTAFVAGWGLTNVSVVATPERAGAVET